jgi:hypothetical protein
MTDDLIRPVRGAFPGPAIEPNSGIRDQLALLGKVGVRYGGLGVAPSLLDNLVAYWKLDETSGPRIDSAGSSNLADNGGVGSATGKVGNAASFDGSNYLSLTSNSNVQITGDFTIACWVYLATLTTTRQMFVTKDNSSDREYILYIAIDNRFTFRIHSVGTLINSATAAQDTWYFLLGDYRASDNRIRLIVNNGTPNTLTGSNSATVGSAEFQIGAREFIGFEEPVLSGGRIDEVGIWKRLLTPAEISILYNSGSGITFPF